MFSFLPTIILRHRKENVKKCSLKGLEKRSDILFHCYPFRTLPNLSSYVVLTLDKQAPVLSEKDRDFGIFLIDATWRYSEVMERQIPQRHTLNFRHLPSNWKTAYPRKQEDCINPSQGLASVEALFIAYQLTGRSTEGLLDHYYWEEEFLKINGISTA